MRVVFYWEKTGLSITEANPYGGLLARGLADIGVEMVAGFAEDLTEQWIYENQGKVDVLHLNWLNYMYAGPDPATQLARATQLLGNLGLARNLGYKIVWTVHNLYPHESAVPDLDRLVRIAITHMATAMIAHCRHAKNLVKEHFYRIAGVYVIPHGHFIDPYPNEISRAEARAQLGIPQQNFVYLFFGNIRPYKGVEQFLETFSTLPGEDLNLLFAAKAYNEYGTSLAERAAHTDPRVVVHSSRFFANEEFQVFLNAADVTVLPFLDVLTSGSAITSLSFGRPVIIPAIGCLPELIDHTSGILYNPQDPAALSQAMTDIRQIDLAAASRAAFQRAQSLSWDGIARQTLEVYRA